MSITYVVTRGLNLPEKNIARAKGGNAPVTGAGTESWPAAVHRR